MLNDQIVEVVKQQKNRATDLIEDFMVAGNGVAARLLEKVSSLRRIVRRRQSAGTASCNSPPPKAGNFPRSRFQSAEKSISSSVKRPRADPFRDVSLAVIKLIGPGEYVLERAGRCSPGHFGLAVQDYTHAQPPLSHPAADDLPARRILILTNRPPSPRIARKGRCRQESRARNVQAACCHCH